MFQCSLPCYYFNFFPTLSAFAEDRKREMKSLEKYCKGIIIVLKREMILKLGVVNSWFVLTDMDPLFVSKGSSKS